MPKLNLRSAIPALGILIAIGGCAESPTGPVEPTAAPSEAKPAAPTSRPSYAWGTQGT